MSYCLGWLCGRCCIPWSETTGDGRGKQCKPPMGYRRWLIDLKIRTFFFLLPSKKKKWHIVRNEFVDVLYCFLDKYSHNIRVHAASRSSHPIVQNPDNIYLGHAHWGYMNFLHIEPDGNYAHVFKCFLCYKYLTIGL